MNDNSIVAATRLVEKKKQLKILLNNINAGYPVTYKVKGEKITLSNRGRFEVDEACLGKIKADISNQIDTVSAEIKEKVVS